MLNRHIPRSVSSAVYRFFCCVGIRFSPLCKFTSLKPTYHEVAQRIPYHADEVGISLDIVEYHARIASISRCQRQHTKSFYHKYELLSILQIKNLPTRNRRQVFIIPYGVSVYVLLSFWGCVALACVSPALCFVSDERFLCECGRRVRFFLRCIFSASRCL